MIEVSTKAEAGRSWLDILSSDDEVFGHAFTARPTLEGSVLRECLVGVEALRAFFQATRSMYDAISFTGEAKCGSRTLLEWEGVFEGGAIAGVTILVHDPGGVIAAVQLHHRPYCQVVAFAVALAQRL